MTTSAERGSGVVEQEVVLGAEQYVIESSGDASRGRRGEPVMRMAMEDMRRDVMSTIVVD